MIKPVTYYVAVCDRCRKEHDGGDYTAWGDAGQALDTAIGSDWVLGADEDPEILTGRLLCSECVEWSKQGDALREKPPISSVTGATKP